MGDPMITTGAVEPGPGIRRNSVLVGVVVALLAFAGCGTATTAPAAPAVPPSAPTPGEVLTAQTFGPMCAQFPTRALAGSFASLSTQPVADAATASTFTQRLSEAIRDAGMTTSLDQRPSVTVFAPYDAAFDQYAKRLGADQFNSLLGDPAALTRVLDNHITVGRRDRQSLLSAGTVPTLAAGQLHISTEGDMVRITDDADDTAHVLCGNIQTANATIYLIDRVLPPGPAQYPPRQ